MESANIYHRNADKDFTANVPAWCKHKPNKSQDLHLGKKLEAGPSIMTSYFQEFKSNYTDKEHIDTDGVKVDMKSSCAVVSDNHSEAMRIPDGSSSVTAEAKQLI